MFRIKSWKTERERRRKISISSKARHGQASTPEKEIERRRKQSEKMTGRIIGPHTDEWKRKVSKAVKLAHQRKEFGLNYKYLHSFKGKTKESGCQRAIAISRSHMGVKPSEEKLRRWFKSCMQKPNGIEKRFIQLCKTNNLPYKYVGNGKLIINSRCPDFVNTNGKKKLIELFGNYWHSKLVTGRTETKEARQRENAYAKFGFKTLIIWERELKDEESLLQKVISFENDGKNAMLLRITNVMRGLI